MRGDGGVIEARGIQALVVWQLSQPAFVEVWREGLPLAMTPLWQLTQVPRTWV